MGYSITNALLEQIVPYFVSAVVAGFSAPDCVFGRELYGKKEEVPVVESETGLLDTQTLSARVREVVTKRLGYSDELLFAKHTPTVTRGRERVSKPSLKPTLRLVISWIPGGEVTDGESAASMLDRLFGASVIAEVDRRSGELKSLWIKHPAISERVEGAPPGY